MTQPVTVQYLEMLNSGDHKPPTKVVDTVQIMEAQINLPLLNRAFYQWVGGPWQWLEKSTWSDQQWTEYVGREDIKTYIGYVLGTPMGYFEIEIQTNKEIQVLYFGLIPTFIGKGLGGSFLSRAIDVCWSYPVDRIWLHTCTLDHPSAIKNYLDRGFKIYKTEIRGAEAVGL